MEKEITELKLALNLSDSHEKQVLLKDNRVVRISAKSLHIGKNLPIMVVDV